MKALVGAFNQEKALVGAFYVIVQLHRLIVYNTTEGREPPIICGYNTGQHMWVPASDSCNQINIDIDTGTTSTTRRWKIKVTQYECGNLNAPEQDCLQYHTAIMGNYPRSRRLVYL